MASVAVGSLFTSTYAAHIAFDLLYYLALKWSVKFNYKLLCLRCARRVLHRRGNLTLCRAPFVQLRQKFIINESQRAREERSDNACSLYSPATVSVNLICHSKHSIVLLNSGARGSVKEEAK